MPNSAGPGASLSEPGSSSSSPNSASRTGICTLSPDELRRLDRNELLREYARTRDLRVRNELVVRHEPLVRSLVARFAPGGITTSEDLVQVGYMGVIAAVERYDPDRSGSFVTFAIPTIVGVMKHWLRDHTWGVRAPRRLRELATRLRRLRDQLEQHHGRAPTIPELAEAAGITEERLLQALEVDRLYRPASLDSPGAENSEESGNTVYDALGDLDPGIPAVDNREALRTAMEFLDERERTIIYQRFFNEASQSELASRLGISQMQSPAWSDAPFSASGRSCRRDRVGV